MMLGNMPCLTQARAVTASVLPPARISRCKVSAP